MGSVLQFSLAPGTNTPPAPLSWQVSGDMGVGGDLQPAGDYTQS